MISKKNGFTLIEVLIALAITSSIIGVTFTFYTFAYKHTLSGREEIALHKKLRIVLEQLEKDIRNCKEIVKISNSELELKIFKNPDYEENHVVLSEEDTTTTVNYKLKKGGPGHPDELQYSVERSLPHTIMKFDKIDENIFKAYTFDLAGQFIPFDSLINDSYQRERISLVVIRLKLTNRKTSAELTGSVCPRYLYGKKKNPYWNFNKNALGI